MKRILFLLLSTVAAFAQVNQGHLTGTTANVQVQLNAKLATNGGTVGGSFFITNAPYFYARATNLWLEARGGAGSFKLLTPGVVAGTATTGQYLQLTDDSDGSVEFAAVSATDATKLPLAGGTMSGAINMGSQRINALAAPAVSTDAANKAYVDTAVGSISSVATFPDSIGEMQALPRMFQGTGRVAYGVSAGNRSGSGNFGSYNSAANFAERVGAAQYNLFREITTNFWQMYVLSSDDGNFATYTNRPALQRYAYVRPALRIRYDGTGTSDGNGGAVGYPIQAAESYIEWTSAAVSTAVTHLGLVIGFMQNNYPVCVVTITDNGTAASVTPNHLPTAQQLVDDGQLLSSTLISGGGTLNPTDRILDQFTSNYSDRNRALHFSIASGLPAGSYTVRVTTTTHYNSSGGASPTQRLYPAYFTYGTAATTETTSGAQLYEWDYISGQNDASANEEFTLSCRPAGVGSYTQIGGGHGYDRNTNFLAYVDGNAHVLRSQVDTVARSANVATIVTLTPHGLAVGDIFTIGDCTQASFDTEGATVASVVSATSFTYANTAGNLGATAEANSFVTNQKLVVGQRVTIVSDGYTVHPSSTVNPMYDYSKVYVVNSTGLELRTRFTTQQSLDIGVSSFNGLNTTWHGVGRGPRWPEVNNWRIIGTGTKGTFSVNNATTTDGIGAGQHAGFLAWSDITGKATAYYSYTPNIAMQNWANGAQFYLQDRGGATAITANTVNKVYFVMTSATRLAVASGEIWYNKITRLDGILLKPATSLY